MIHPQCNCGCQGHAVDQQAFDALAATLEADGQYWEAVLEALPFGALMFNPKLLVSGVNVRCARMWGIEVPQIRGASLEQLQARFSHLMPEPEAFFELLRIRMNDSVEATDICTPHGVPPMTRFYSPVLSPTGDLWGHLFTYWRLDNVHHSIFPQGRDG